MPYKKGGEAEQRGKLRRKAKRRIKTLERAMNESDSEKERQFYSQQISTIRRYITQTYVRNPETYQATGYRSDDLELAKQNLTRQLNRSDIGRSEQKRKNFITQQELNSAQPYSEGVEQEFTKEEVKIFYRATQKAWEGLSNAQDRNAAILRHYGKNDLREFVREVLDMNKEAVRIAHGGAHETSADESEIKADGEENVPYNAEYLAYVVSPELNNSVVNEVR